MTEIVRPSVHQRWAHLRFSVVGPLLAAPPARGELAADRRAGREDLAPPGYREPLRFGVSTIERWYTRPGARRSIRSAFCAAGSAGLRPAAHDR